jgi:hypothetical protein
MPFVADHPTDTEVARRLDELQTVCAELYQVLGTLGAPERVLDQASAAAEGRPLPYPSLLPFSVKEAKPGVAAALLGARGGMVATVAKRLAAAKNGLLGGRPRRRVAYKIAARKK